MFESALLIASGVALYGGIHQLQLGIRQSDGHPHAIHALMFFLLSGFAIAGAVTATAQSVTMLSSYGKLAVSLGILLWAALPWFLVLYIQHKNLVVPALLTALWSMLLLLNLGSPHSLLYREIHTFNQAGSSGQLFIGLQTSTSAWWWLVELSTFFTLIFAFYVIYQHYRDKKESALIAGTGLLILLCTALTDSLVNAGLIESPYLTPMGFLLFLLIPGFLMKKSPMPASPAPERVRNSYRLAVDSDWTPTSGSKRPAEQLRTLKITDQPAPPAFSFMEVPSNKSAMQPVTLEPDQSSTPADEPPHADNETEFHQPIPAWIDQSTVGEVSDSLVDIAVHATMILNRLEAGDMDPEELRALSEKVRTRAIETRRITHRILRDEDDL
ncbi:MAG: hypothetical protein RQ736_05035 [Thiogranum sp.]|nr:hypothetical protein [Thiogranum sp.]